MKAEHCPAKQVIRVEILVFLCQSYFVVLLEVKNQAAVPGVVHVDVEAPWRSEEAASGVFFLQDTHFSRFPRHVSLSSFPHDKRSSRRSLSYSSTHFDRTFPVFAVLPCHVQDADCVFF